MNQNRQYHAMTLLANGNQVLVTGGESSESSINTVELYDINTGIWTLTPNNMLQRRVLHSSTLLNNGHVLITGEIIDDDQTAFCYDPTSSTWTKTELMIASYRESPTATLLTNGRVLVIGGATASKVARDIAEIYDSTTNTWIKTSSNIFTGRYYHAAVRFQMVLYQFPTYGGLQMTLTSLSNGYVLSTPSGNAKAHCPVLTEVYNSSTKKWLKIGFLNIERQSNLVFRISDRVFTYDDDNTKGTLDSCEFFSFT